MGTSTQSELTRQLLGAVHEVMGRSDVQLRETLDGLDLTVPLAEALRALDPRLPSPAMKTLAARLHCDPSSATFLVTRLERQGLTERVPDPVDGRSKTVELTDKGALVRAELMAAMVEHSPLATLGTAELTTALHLFRKALAQNDAARRAPGPALGAPPGTSPAGPLASDEDEPRGRA